MKGREHKVRLKTDAHGALIRQLKNSNLAIFARKNSKRAVERTGVSQDHYANYPERAPFRTGIAESAGDYKSKISAQIVAVWNDLQK